MGLSASDYVEQLQGMLPPGPAWPQEPDALLTRMLDGLSAELARIDERSLRLIEEEDPRTTFELLSDFERAFSLSPNSIIDGTPLSIDQRRANLISRMTERGGQSRAYFINKALKLGFAITITEFKEWSVSDSVEAALCGPDWNFAWQVNAPLITASDWSVESDVETPFAVIWLAALLEASFQEDKPAHTVVIFKYS